MEKSWLYGLRKVVRVFGEEFVLFFSHNFSPFNKTLAVLFVPFVKGHLPLKHTGGVMCEHPALCETHYTASMHSLHLKCSIASGSESKRAQLNSQRSSETGCEGESWALENSSLVLFSALTCVDIWLLVYLLVTFLQTCVSICNKKPQKLRLWQGVQRNETKYFCLIQRYWIKQKYWICLISCSFPWWISDSL